MTDLEQLIARDQIRQLAHRYALHLDSRDFGALVDLFVEDVRVGAEGRGREALQRSFAAQMEEIGVSMLFVGNHVIAFDGPGRARGVVYCKAEMQRDGGWLQQAIQYRDVYERRGDDWLFVRRLHLLVYGVRVEPDPSRAEPADWPRTQTGWGSFPASWTSLPDFWKPPRS